jgi:hypothetical protein
MQIKSLYNAQASLRQLLFRPRQSFVTGTIQGEKRREHIHKAPQVWYFYFMDSFDKHSGLLHLFIYKQNCLSPKTAIWRKTLATEKIMMIKKGIIMKRFFIPITAFILGSMLIASFYLGILTWAQGWDYASSQLSRDRFYVVPIILGFGAQAALYSVLRFRLFIPVTSTSHTGTLMGTSGGTSATAMVACCIHHVTDVLPILGLSAVASFLTRYQRPFMLVGLTMNILSIITMLFILYRERQKLQPVLEAK